MSLFYNPTLKRKGKKPMSKTAQKKNLVELKKLFKEVGMYDNVTKDVLTTLETLLNTK